MQLHPFGMSTDRTEESDEKDVPQQQFSIRSLWQISENWQFDTTLRYVDRIAGVEIANKEKIDYYLTFDFRIAWQAHELIELSFVGQNMFGKHREFRASAVDTQATDVEPSLFVKANLHF